MKLIKNLKNFTLDDIQTLIEDDIELNEYLKLFEKEQLIKQISPNTYTYIPTIQTLKKDDTNIEEWLKVNCNNDLSKLTVETIKPETFFINKDEIDIYNSAKQNEKVTIVKCYTLIRICSNLSGKVLKAILEEISTKYPHLRLAYSTFIAIKRNFNNEGLSSFMKRKYHKDVQFRCPEILEEIIHLYLEQNYTYEATLDILRQKYDDSLLPSKTTLTRYLKCNYSEQEIKNFRNKKNQKGAIKKVNLKRIKSVPILSNTEILEIIKNKSPELWVLAMGIKPTEIEALHYEDIDFESGRILIDKFKTNCRIKKYDDPSKVRRQKIHPILLASLDKKGTGLIYEQTHISNYKILMFTHVKLLLDLGVPVDIICKNLGVTDIDNFKEKYKLLLNPFERNDFDIFKNVYNKTVLQKIKQLFKGE